MGYQMPRAAANRLFKRLLEHYDIIAPKVFTGEGCFSDTDIVRYGKVSSLSEIEFEKKSDYSFKEALLPVNETLFYFTEDQTSVPSIQEKKRLVFLRSCELHALRRLDTIYLDNGREDFYYKRLREKTLFVLIGCPESCDTGFCVSMGTNRTDSYDLYLNVSPETVWADCRSPELDRFFSPLSEDAKETAAICQVSPKFPDKNKETVTLPASFPEDILSHPIWERYGNRCTGCGRCNFVCPTCTCFTMQDIHYRDNENVGERRRVWASCQVDGYTDIAGGGGFRKSQSDRLRFKVLHKICDFEKRFDHQMCVGCGRCEAVCPEYISYIHIINTLAKEDA
ncbi:MAG: anaerobic sulfite reductase subunit AsrA [Lachnospiraceae bacterium]|jgi:anaerobic sulfite reductase subunit A|nr:anaerobic sulfite reductase subunit AsrA [Lachnospiraceae bacterium]